MACKSEKFDRDSWWRQSEHSSDNNDNWWHSVGASALALNTAQGLISSIPSAWSRQGQAAAISSLFHCVVKHNADTAAKQNKSDTTCPNDKSIKKFHVLGEHVSDITDTGEFLRLSIAKRAGSKCKTLNDAIVILRSKVQQDDKRLRSLNALNHATTGIRHFDSIDLATFRRQTIAWLDEVLALNTQDNSRDSDDAGGGLESSSLGPGTKNNNDITVSGPWLPLSSRQKDQNGYGEKET